MMNRYRHDTSTRDFLDAIANDCGRSSESVESLVRELIDKGRETVFELHEISSREWAEIYHVPKSLVMVIRKYLNEIIKREPILQMRFDGSLARNEEKTFTHQIKSGVYCLRASNENTFFLPGQYFSIVIRCSKIETSESVSSTSSGASPSYPQNSSATVDAKALANTAPPAATDGATVLGPKTRLFFFQDSCDFVRVSENYKSVFSVSNEQAPSKVECVVTSHVKFGLPKIRYVIELKRIGNIEDDDYFDLQETAPQRSQSMTSVVQADNIPSMPTVQSELPINSASPLTEENLMLFNMTHNRRVRSKNSRGLHHRSQSQEVKPPATEETKTESAAEVGASDSGDNINSELGYVDQEETEEWQPDSVMSFYLASNEAAVAAQDPVHDSADDSDHRPNDDTEVLATTNPVPERKSSRTIRHNRNHLFVPTMVSDELRSTVSFDSDISAISSISDFSTQLSDNEEG